MDDILILQAARFGDLVQTKRLVLSLARKASIHLCVDRSLASLARLLYPRACIHEVYFHERPGMDGFKHNQAVFRKLRELDFRRVYNCNFSRLTAEICRLFPDEKIIGYRPAHNSSGGMECSPWSRLAFRLSGMRNATPLNLVDFWAWLDDDPVAPREVNPVARAGGGGIGIALSGRDARRSLPAQVLAPAAQTVFRLLGSPPVKLFGSRLEEPAARKLLKRLPTGMQAKTVSLAGKTDWKGLIDELSGLDILMTPDTGIMHLAAHLGVPVLAFFLSSAWCHETGPYGSGHIVWQAARQCSPCLESATCPHGVACLAPFQEGDFQRALAVSLRQPGAGTQEPPPGLQCWRSGLDSLGARLELAAGHDYSQKKRDAIRIMLGRHLGLQDFEGKFSRMSASDFSLLYNMLFPFSEWMLPAWRYC